MGTLKHIRLEELAVIGVLLFFGVSGAIPGIAPNQASEMTGVASTRLQLVAGVGSQLLVNAIVVTLLVRHLRLFLQHRARLAWAGALPLWAIASILWSQDPLLTARRALPFSLAAAFGAYLALRFSRERFLILLQIAFTLLACWSAVLALGFPAIGLDASTGHGGDWQGVFTQKNACGRAMVFAVAAVLAQGALTPARCLLCVLFGLELALSGSRGAWLLGVMVVATLALFGAACRMERATRASFLSGSALLAICAGSFAFAQFQNLALLLNRDPTLTGRTAIWHQVLISISHRPVLGYGFSAFWRGAQGASWDVVVALKFVLFHAHNGFLEIWLELGAAGLTLLAFSLMRSAFLLWPELQAGRFADAAWPFSTLLLIVAYDVDENTLLSFNGLFWVLYVTALVQVEVLAADRRFIRRLACAQRSAAEEEGAKRIGWLSADPALASTSRPPYWREEHSDEANAQHPEHAPAAAAGQGWRIASVTLVTERRRWL